MIKAVAIKLKSGEVKTLPAPCRHADVMMDMQRGDFPGHIQGFIDEHGKFFTRQEAWWEADKCGQLIIHEGRTYCGALYSEDVW